LLSSPVDLESLSQYKNGSHPNDASRSSLIAEIRFYSVHLRMISVALIPPNPNEFDNATSKLCGTATFGT